MLARSLDACSILRKLPKSFADKFGLMHFAAALQLVTIFGTFPEANTSAREARQHFAMGPSF